MLSEKIMPLKIIFAGSPEFALPSLQSLLNSPHEVVAVYTQPDRKAGRGRKLVANPVKQLAQKHHLLLEQPTSFREPGALAKLQAYQADLMVVVAYGLILPQAVLEAPKYGCINVHASCLPRWRGASPIQAAILANDTQTGITIIQLVQALDAGDMLAQAVIPITPDDTSQSLQQRLAKLGASLLTTVLTQVESQTVQAIKQEERLVTYAPKLVKVDAEINWHDCAAVLERKVRAFYGWPVCYTHLQDQVLRIWQVQVATGSKDFAVGTVWVEENKLFVACGIGTLQLLQVQLPGGKIISAADFINAMRTKLQFGKTKLC